MAPDERHELAMRNDRWCPIDPGTWPNHFQAMPALFDELLEVPFRCFIEVYFTEVGTQFVQTSP